MHLRRILMLGCLQLVACGGGGTGGADTSSYLYVNWSCANVSGCIANMGHNTGSAGPFCGAASCNAWRQQYITSSTCNSSAIYPIYNAPPAGTCQ